MKAAILERLNAPLMLDDIEIPELNCGQVLVEVHRSGICGRQLGEISGAKGEDPYLPHLLGHEGGGIVVGIGDGVSRVKDGDHVVMHWRKGAGIEAEPARYRRWGDNTVGAGPITTFSEYAVISENRLTPIGEDIPFDVAALMGCAVTTGLGLVNNEAKLKIGQSIAVAGCGGVGLSVIQGAAMVSANPIIAIDLHREKLDMARRFGATHAINSSEVDLLEEIFKIFVTTTNSIGPDVFVDCTGSVNMGSQGFAMIAPGGKAILAGQPFDGRDFVIRSIRQHYQGKTLMDSQGGLTNPTVDIPRYLDLYRAGKLNLDDLITHRFPLERVNDALDTVRSGMAGRCILVMR